MNTEHLHYLLTIEQSHSINQAAETLHLQRTYLSKVVNNLEQQLGIIIFERGPKGVVPTPDGVYALKQIKEALGILDQLELNFRLIKEEQYPSYYDNLVLYYPPRMRPRGQLITILEDYQNRFPNVVLTLAEKNSACVAEVLLNKKNHIALVSHSDTITQLNWEIPTQLQFVPLTELPIVALVSEKHPLATSFQTISLTTLCKQKLILMHNDTDDLPPFYNLLSSYGEPNIKHVISGNISLFYEMMDTGRYFSLGAFSRYAKDGLQQIPLRENVVVTMGVLYDPVVQENIPTKALIEDFLKLVGKTDIL